MPKRGRPFHDPDNPLSRSVKVRIDEQTLGAIRKVAGKSGLGSWIRILIREALKQ